jgi:hypothetical protein
MAPHPAGLFDFWPTAECCFPLNVWSTLERQWSSYLSRKELYPCEALTKEASTENNLRTATSSMQTPLMLAADANIPREVRRV